MEKKLPVLADVKIQIKKMMQLSRNSFLFEISSDYILRNLMQTEERYETITSGTRCFDNSSGIIGIFLYTRVVRPSPSVQYS